MFNSFSKLFKFSVGKFYKCVIDQYVKLYCDTNENTLIQVKIFVSNLPELKLIEQILIKKLVTKKEIVGIKIVLDIYEHYYRNFDLPCYINFTKEYFPIALLFYSQLSDADLAYIYEKILCLKEILGI